MEGGWIEERGSEGQGRVDSWGGVVVDGIGGWRPRVGEQVV